MSEPSWNFLKNLFFDNPESADRDGYSANKVWIKNTEIFDFHHGYHILVRYDIAEMISAEMISPLSVLNRIWLQVVYIWCILKLSQNDTYKDIKTAFFMKL